ncbi:MAG: hypothetical protein ACI9NQ_000438 [Paracoccaceae bacterium]|jgi:hypothetical protein
MMKGADDGFLCRFDDSKETRSTVMFLSVLGFFVGKPPLVMIEVWNCFLMKPPIKAKRSS